VSIADWEQKVWGRTRLVYADAHLAVNELVVLPNAWCSEHRHRAKFNTFEVASGVLTVRVFVDGGHVDELLTPHKPGFAVFPTYWHQFRTGEEATHVYEVYRAGPGQVLDLEDIERRTQGSRLGAPESAPLTESRVVSMLEGGPVVERFHVSVHDMPSPLFSRETLSETPLQQPTRPTEVNLAEPQRKSEINAVKSPQEIQ